MKSLKTAQTSLRFYSGMNTMVTNDRFKMILTQLMVHRFMQSLKFY